MTHYKQEQWLAYARGSEIARTDMESHLAACDECLGIYIEALNHPDNGLPVLPDIRLFAQQVVSSIPESSDLNAASLTAPERSRSWFAQPLFHYAIAACITIVLVGSGAFQQLFDHYSALSRETEFGNTTAITEQLTDRAGQWLDTIPAKYAKKEGKP